VEEPHRRAPARWLPALAWRRCRAPGGLQQPCSAAVRSGPSGIQAPSRGGGARLCADPGSRRHATGLATRPRERAQALPDPRRRVQPGVDHAPADRSRDSAGVPGAGCGVVRRVPCCRWRLYSASGRDCRRSDCSARDQLPAWPIRLKGTFLNGLLAICISMGIGAFRGRKGPLSASAWVDYRDKMALAHDAGVTLPTKVEIAGWP
jgi:hypothetical protein